MKNDAKMGRNIWNRMEKNRMFTIFALSAGFQLDLSTPTGMSCIGTYGENCKSSIVSKKLCFISCFSTIMA